MNNPHSDIKALTDGMVGIDVSLRRARKQLVDAVWITDKATWPTPRANENSQGPTNVQAITEAGSSWIGQNRGATVSTMAQVHSGTTPSGLPEPTEKRGELNPEFVSWLMGFPVEEWLMCAPEKTGRKKKTSTAE